jgi:hypothetical protein
MGLKQKLGRGEKKERRGDGPRGIGLGFVFFFFFFLFFSNPLQTLLNSHLLHVFKFKF